MCGGIKYTDTNKKEWKIYFPNPKAALPVLKKDGEVEWVKWGIRKEEQVLGFVSGGWARLDSIKSGKWERYEPRPVLIPAQSFMEKDELKVSHWIDMPSSQALQGLLLVQNHETRVYVVTTDVPEEYSYIHDRWPRVVDMSVTGQ